MQTAACEPRPIQTRLGLWDTASIIVGIIIGVGIFKTPAEVFHYASGPWAALAIWGFAGLLSLIGAFCFAELASTYPRSGGEYVYLTKAYGPLTGFLFAWAQLAVIRTGGSIAALAYVFADFAGNLFTPGTGGKALLAALAIAVLSVVNILGVRFGKRTQNALTVLKIVGLAVLLATALIWGRPAEPTIYEGGLLRAADDTLRLRSDLDGKFVEHKLAAGAAITVDGSDRNHRTGKAWRLEDLEPGHTVKVRVRPTGSVEVTILQDGAPNATGLAGLALALILVLWTYSGWHEGAYVAAEVENRRRNLPLALILGTGAVVLLYLLVNAAYILGLGYKAAANSSTIAADVLELLPLPYGRQAMSILIMLSALGAINGMIFTSSRIYSELGADHRLFASLGRWSRRWGTPVRSLVVQAVLSIAMVAVVGVWFQGGDGFDTLVKCTAPVFCVFFFLTGTSLIILRFKEPGVERPFVAPLYPVTPLVFCAFWAFMLCGSVLYAPREACVGLGVLLAGLPLYALSQVWQRDPKGKEPEPLTALGGGEPGIQKPVGSVP